MDERALSKLLLALTGKDATEGPPTPTPCPPLPRLRTALLREDSTEAEREHIRACPRCQRSCRQLQEHVWHPTLLHLFWHARGLLDQDTDVRHHLDEGCRRCLRLATVFGADRVLGRLAGHVGAAAAELGRTLAGGAVAVLAGAETLFEDGRSSARLSVDPPRLVLRLPPATGPRLVRVLVGDQQRQGAHFAVPRPERDDNAQTAVIPLETAPPPRAVLVVYETAPGLLHKDDAPALQAAFAAAARTDPLALAGWQRWAEQVRSRPDLDSSLRPVLTSLARLTDPPAR